MLSQNELTVIAAAAAPVYFHDDLIGSTWRYDGRINKHNLTLSRPSPSGNGSLEKGARNPNLETAHLRAISKPYDHTRFVIWYQWIYMHIWPISCMRTKLIVVQIVQNNQRWFRHEALFVSIKRTYICNRAFLQSRTGSSLTQCCEDRETRFCNANFHLH